MLDREKVVKDLTYIVNVCSLRGENCENEIDREMYADWDSIISNALALLEAQRSVKPVKQKGYSFPLFVSYKHVCENCETPLLFEQPYCSGCGSQVKWE